jgi:2,3-dihydroxyphenylpropionate 1,2-dioxygenase
MTLAVAALSHAPSFGNVDPGGTTFAEINEAIGEVRAFVEDFDPEVVIAFGPDHFNGVLYSMMPPFAIGAQAEGVGDYGTSEGPLPVDSETARELHAAILADGIDIARSERLMVDHGILQPLEFLFGHDLKRSFVPLFVNAIGMPLTPMSRVRLMGEAVGRAAQRLDKRVLMMASGGLSHDPPIPAYDGAPAPLQERLISYAPTKDERAARESKIIEGIQAIAEGRASSAPLNVEWDQMLLEVFRSGELSTVDGWDNQQFIDDGGSAAHEMRTWIAAFSALTTAGDYHLVVDKYWPVKTWGAGFGVTAAITDRA